MSTNIIDDFKLLDLVQQNSHLYDKNNPEYRELLKKNITWKAIGAALGAPGELCRKRFRCLRDRFNKERKIRQEEMLTDPSLPAVFKKMLFLWDHLTHRRLVPVAIRLSSELTDQSEDAKDVIREIERDMLILKEDDVETAELQNVSDEDIDDSKTYGVIAHIPEEKLPQNSSPEENSIVHSNIVLENEPSTSTNITEQISQAEETSQILCEKQIINDNLAGTSVNFNGDCTNDKQKLLSENCSLYTKPLRTDIAHKNKKEAFAKNKGKAIRGKFGTKRTFLRSNVPRVILPNTKRKMSNFTERNSNEINSQTTYNVSTSRPSCNEAFCIVVKSYLDRITNPERLSAARLQILTILHNELYSTYS